MARIEQHFCWPTMNRDIVHQTQSCRRCAATLQQGKGKATLHTRPKESRPFELLEADIKGPVPKAKNGYNNILVLTDPTTKFAELHPITNQQSSSVCKKLKAWISRYGIPKRLHSDNGPCFISEDLDNLCKEYGIEHTFSDPYRPQGNSGVERLNRTMAEAITKLADNHPSSWPDHLPDVQLAYNAAKHSSTGVAPYKLVFKAHPRTKFDMVAARLSPETVDRCTELLQKRGDEVYERARAQDEDHSRQRVEKHNQSIKSFQPFQVGDKVWKKKMKKRTFEDQWEGPFIIVQRKGTTSYVVRRVGGTKESIVHHNYLKSYISHDEHRKSKETSNIDAIPPSGEHGVPQQLAVETSESESEEEVEEQARRYPLRARRRPDRLII